MIHHCLFTFKTIIAVLQKCEQITYKESIFTYTSTVKNIVQVAKSAINTIEDENFLIECRNAAAMILPSILLHNPKNLPSVLSDIVYSSSITNYEENNIYHFIPNAMQELVNDFSKPSSVVVMLHAILVKLPSYFPTQLSNEFNFHVDFFVNRLERICIESKDKNTLVLAFKTFCLWATTITNHENAVSFSGAIMDRVIPFLITYVDHGIDTIRHSVTASLKQCFDFVSKFGKLSMVSDLTREYFTSDIKARGKLTVLTSLCELASITSILKFRPTLSEELLKLLSDVDLASHATSLYRAASKKHLAEMQKDNTSIATWKSTWIDGISTGLLCNCKDMKANLVNYIVPAMLKVNPVILNILMMEAQKESSLVKFYTAVVFLKTARGMKNTSQDVFNIPSGVSSSTDRNGMWKNLFKTKPLEDFIVHSDDQVCIYVIF